MREPAILFPQTKVFPEVLAIRGEFAVASERVAFLQHGPSYHRDTAKITDPKEPSIDFLIRYLSGLRDSRLLFLLLSNLGKRRAVVLQ